MLSCLPVLLLLHLGTISKGDQGSLSQRETQLKDLIAKLRTALTWFILYYIHWQGHYFVYPMGVS
jgi:hypothetical protein